MTDAGWDDLQNASIESRQYTRRNPNEFQVEVNTSTQQFLVVSENWYPGWKATVNGIRQKVYRSYGTLMGVVIGPGHSQVIFSYRPTHFIWSVLYTAAACLTLLIAATIGFNRRRPKAII